MCTWCVTFHTWGMNIKDGKTFHQENHDRLQKTVTSPLLLRCRWMQTEKRKKNCKCIGESGINVTLAGDGSLVE